MSMLGPDAHFCGIGDVNPKKFDTTTICSLNEDNQDSTNDEVILRKIICNHKF
jgi:hypothetical protein